MNVGVRVSFQVRAFVFSGSVAGGVGLQDHRVTLVLVFKGTATLFATVAALRVHFVWSIHCVSFCYTLTWAFHVPFYNSFCTGFLNV